MKRKRQLPLYMGDPRTWRKRQKRYLRDRKLSGGRPWQQMMKANGLRARLDREDDAVELPKPLPPRPPRRERRGQGKPGRRM